MYIWHRIMYSFTIVMKIFYRGDWNRIQVGHGGKRHLWIGTACHVSKRAKSLFWGVTNIPAHTYTHPPLRIPGLMHMLCRLWPWERLQCCVRNNCISSCLSFMIMGNGYCFGARAGHLNYWVSIFSKKAHWLGAKEMAQQLKNSWCSCRRPGLRSHYSQGYLQPSLFPVSEDPVFSSHFCGHLVYMWYNTYM